MRILKTGGGLHATEGEFISFYHYLDNVLSGNAPEEYLVNHMPCHDKAGVGYIEYKRGRPEYGCCRDCGTRCPDELIEKFYKLWKARYVLTGSEINPERLLPDSA